MATRPKPLQPRDARELPANPWVFLWLDVVYQALLDIQQLDPYKKRDAVEWITSGEDGERTFKWCCEQADMNPEYVRRANGLWEAEDIARKMPSRADWIHHFKRHNAGLKLRKFLDRERAARHIQGQEKEGG